MRRRVVITGMPGFARALDAEILVSNDFAFSGVDTSIVFRRSND